MEQEKIGLVWNVNNPFQNITRIQTEIQKSDYLHFETEDDRKDGLFGQEQKAISTLIEFNLGDWFNNLHLQYLESDMKVCHEHGRCTDFNIAERTDIEDGVELNKNIDRFGVPFAHGHPMPNIDEKDLILAFNSNLYFDEDEFGFGFRFTNRNLDVNPENMQETWLNTTPNYYDKTNENAISISGDWVHYLSENSDMQISLGYIERLPASSELFWNGFHHATESYILGERDLESENSINFDFDIFMNHGDWSSQISSYYYHFFNYIYQSPLANTSDPFHNSPVWKMSEVEAKVYGGAILERYRKVFGKHKVNLSFGLEMIRGEIVSGGDLPRIAPLNWTFETEHIYQKYSGSLKYKYVDKSRFEAENETSTDSYGWLSAKVDYKDKFNDLLYKFYIKGENLTDEVARNHLSFLKDTALLPGRQISFGVELEYK